MQSSFYFEVTILHKAQFTITLVSVILEAFISNPLIV